MRGESYLFVDKINENILIETNLAKYSKQFSQVVRLKCEFACVNDSITSPDLCFQPV